MKSSSCQLKFVAIKRLERFADCCSLIVCNTHRLVELDRKLLKGRYKLFREAKATNISRNCTTTITFRKYRTRGKRKQKKKREEVKLKKWTRFYLFTTVYDLT